jgi:thiamine biosynthesis lipoprotein
MQSLLIDISKSEFKRQVKLMGNQFEITVVMTDEIRADKMIDLAIDEIRRIEKLLTTYDDRSETNLINQHAGVKPVKVSKEVLELIKRSLKISRVTDGAFDITYGSIDKNLWNFNRSLATLPDEVTARKMVKLVDYRNVIIDERNSTVMLKRPGMRIGFGGIGKGYAADRARIVLEKHGVESGIVNASGDLIAWGMQANGEPWSIGISHPDNPSKPLARLQLTNMAIATSGNYEKYIVIDGKKYSHTIHPKTGLPVRGVKSVTVIASNGEIADAMATPVMVMGASAGLALINQISGIECILIDDDNKIHYSKNIQMHD